MRPHARTDTVHIDNGVRREFEMEMSEDAADAAFVLQTLTDLYSDPHLAYIREVPSNALDSHIAAGQTRPIAITLPTRDNPHFVVQDWGVGLNDDDMENIYVKFGKSTKRNSDSATGMLGLGCKAPLSACLSFTVKAIKDGVKVVGVVTKNKMGLGVMRMLGDPITFTPEQIADPDIDTHNGVTVSIPVSTDKIDEVREKAHKFFRFWREGVLVDGKPPELIKSELRLDPDIWVIENDRGRVGDSYVVQGNVPYPYKTEEGLPATVTWVPMGTIDFTPAREALHHTELTTDTLETIRDYIRNSVIRMIDSELDATTSRYERLRKAMSLRRTLPYGFQHPELPRWYGGLNLTPKNGKIWKVVRDTAERHDYINGEWIESDKFSYVYGFPFKTVSRLHKDKIQEAGIKEPYVVVPADAGINLDGFPRRHWDSIPDLPKEVRQSRVYEGSRGETRYDIYIAGTHHSLTRYEGDLSVVWVDNDRDLARSLSGKYPLAVGTIILTQKDRFERLHDGAKVWREWINPYAKSLERRLTKGDKRYLDATYWERALSHHFRDVVSNVKDKELRQHLNLSRSDHLDKLFTLTNWAAEGSMRAIDEDLRQKILHIQRGRHHEDKKPNTDHYVHVNYPLLWAGGGYNRTAYDETPAEEWLVYLNAKYREVKKAAKQAVDSTSDDDDTSTTDDVTAACAA